MPSYISPGEAEGFYFDDHRDGFNMVVGEDLRLDNNLDDLEGMFYDDEEVRKFLLEQRELFN